MPQRSADLADLLWAYDDARYCGDMSEADAAYTALANWIARDPAEAERRLAALGGCARTRQRHQGYVRAILRQLSR
jgi:hypothetical protein